MNKSSVRRWKCVCAYDGTGFAGWQSQAAGKGRAIQDVIEKRLAEIFGAPIRIHGSGRTDSGVHASGQVFHFDAEWRHGAAKLLAAFRVGLPPQIQVKSAQIVAADFHSRFTAKAKRYVYHLYHGHADPFAFPYFWSMQRPLDVPAMRAAAAVLRGRHDFRAFTAFNGQDQADAVRDLRRLEIVQRGKKLRIVAEADGFLYKMVRSLVGVLVSVGEGKLTPDRVREILLSKTRTERVLTAPPQGLFLDRVFYR
ncbi:MAG TPA: tRNA pseudouridine(38-40) synthase TruA [Opitutaceae bacterium]|nr:tRNA pseudouridine(38-40) synthase TruA [Opitutaceae bacterium]